MTSEPLDDIARVRAVVRRQFGSVVTDVQPLKGGVFSRAFAFTAGDQGYVVRLSAFAHAAESFAKDDFAARHYSAPALPIPRVVTTGKDGDDFFVISERAA